MNHLRSTGHHLRSTAVRESPANVRSVGEAHIVSFARILDP